MAQKLRSSIAFKYMEQLVCRYKFNKFLHKETGILVKNVVVQYSNNNNCINYSHNNDFTSIEIKFTVITITFTEKTKI